MKALTPKFPTFLHGADYNPEQWLNDPGVFEKDIELLKKAHMNCVSVGIFSWAKLEPEEGVFTFDWLQHVIDKLYENGIYTVLATPSGSKPYWMSEKYEEIRRVSHTLVRDGSGERHNHCYTSPVYREKVKIMDKKLAEQFASHPGVILWHISNEYGGRCYCEKCQEAFRGWLQKKYQTLDALNEAWWTTFWSHTYSGWSQIHAPAPNGETGTHGLSIDWNRFCSDQAADFMAEEISHVKSVNPDIPVTANFMYNYDCYNYKTFADKLDVVSWDAYPEWHSGDNVRTAAEFAFWHDYMRTLKKQPFLLMESTPSTTNWRPTSKLKKPGMHMTASMQAVAHGSDSVQYFQFRKSRGSCEKFHGAVVDHNGEGNTRVFADVTEVGRRLTYLSGVYGSMPKPRVAIIYDVENSWAIDFARGPRNVGMHYLDTLKDHYEAFWQMGIPVDIISEEDDISGYNLVISPLLYMIREGFDQKLRAFVQNGGTLVSSYHSHIVNDTDLCFLGGWPGNMMDVFGIWNEEIDSLEEGETNTIVTSSREYKVRELCALLHTNTADVLGVYGSDFYKGSPALTANQYGAGKAYYIAARPGKDFYMDFYQNLVSKLQISRVLPVELPYGVAATIRESETDAYMFVQNFLEIPQTVSLNREYAVAESNTLITEMHLRPFETVILRDPLRR